MQTIDSSQIQLSNPLLACLERGETIAIRGIHGTLAFLVPAQMSGAKRPFGLAQGEFTVPDDFNEPSPEIEELFYGKE